MTRSYCLSFALLVFVAPLLSGVQAETPEPDLARWQAILRDPGATEQQKQTAMLELRHAGEIRSLREAVALLERRNLALTEHCEAIRELRETYSKLLAERTSLLQKFTEARDGHLGDKRLFEAYSALGQERKLNDIERGFMQNMSRCVFPFLQPGAERMNAAQLTLDRHDLRMNQVLEQIIRREIALPKAAGQPE